MHIEIVLTQTEVIITSIAPPLIFAAYHILKCYFKSKGVLRDVEQGK